MEKKRYAELDIAKGIGILLVIVGHIQYIHLDFRNFIVAFHIPLFFIISGMLICIQQEEQKSFVRTFQKKCKSILQPYFIFSVIFIGIQFFLYRLGFSVTLDMIKENIYLTVIFYGMSVLWFLGALFAGELAFLAVIKSCKKKWTAIVLILWLIISCIANRILQNYCTRYEIYADHSYRYYPVYFFQMIIRTGIITFFIGIGFYLWEWKKKIQIIPWLTGIVGILCIAATVFISRKNGGVDLHYLVFHQEGWYFSGAILGSIGVLAVSYAVKEFAEFPLFKVLIFYGKNSLIVMMTHVDTYLMYVATILVMHFNPWITDYYGNVYFCIELFLLVALVEVIVVLIINRYMPWLIGKKREGE
jgi:fucose 4-O-acetylase-like acetyltransferase